MSLSSSFNDFSLAELFKLIEERRRSGCLTVCTLPDIKIQQSKSRYFYLWFHRGRFVTATNNLRSKSLATSMARQGYASPAVIDEIIAKQSGNKPLGLYLKTEGVIGAEQLNVLFANQLRHVRNLFEIQKGVFKFDSKANLPWNEMTGLSVGAIQVAIMALRVLKRWEIMSDVLPHHESAIADITDNKTHLHLNAFERQVWEFANGCISLNDVATELKQPILLIQGAAYRLMLANLVEEIPMVRITPGYKTGAEIDHWNPKSIDSISPSEKLKDIRPQTLNSSFLQNLVGFLRSHA
ncbi:MAG: DUF4388 domain-containing protein [Cyanobacteria bacterium P01_A01_bin.84]